MKKTLAVTVYQWHGFWLKLGPKLGGAFVKMVALYCLYKVVTNGGIEALSYVCYEHMLREGEAERTKKQDAQTGMRKK